MESEYDALKLSNQLCFPLYACAKEIVRRYKPYLDEIDLTYTQYIAMMVLCLAGINTVDLYNLKKQDYRNGIIHYQRAKTKKFRADGAYMEMRVPAIIQPLFDKYLNTKEDDDRLFNFYQRMTTSDSFGSNVNSGIRQICEAMGMAKEERYSVYTFRHTWGTVAQNDVRASIDEVAFAMNHAAGHKVTRGYIKIDYSPAWELNEKVVDFIFFSGKTSVREQKQEDTHFRLSFRYMVNGAAYHNGQKVAELKLIEGRPTSEVCDQLSISEKACYSRVSRIRKYIKSLLKREDWP